MTPTPTPSRLASAALLTLALLLCAAPQPARAQSVIKAHQALNDWKIDEARRQIQGAEAVDPASVELLAVKARLAFFSGDYKGALTLIEQALTQAPKRAEFLELRALIKSTHEVTARYEKHTSPSGRFIVYVEPGKDRVLIPYAFEALELAYDSIALELGYKPPTPIRVEVYPRTATLAAVSSLTEAEIRTSGTIALCKYNRLMITSPKALARGYEWVDTLVHEYVHYAINHKSASVPIWMHEGMAKFLERRWRGPDAHRLPPSSEHLLAERVAGKGKLITFDQMHPSMAKLPSQEDAAVAFAEVFTVMEYLRKQLGEGAFGKVLDHINAGLDAKTAFALALATTFEEFERVWMAYLKQRPRVKYPDDTGFEDRLVFKDADKTTTLEKLPKPAARDHLHLGELLQARGRHEAAVAQYRKASKLMGDAHPFVQTRLAQSLLALNRPKDALDALQGVKAAFPSYVQTWIQLGRASLATGDAPAALDALTEAARINPFDPEIHTLLIQTYTKLNRKKELAVAKANLALVK